MKPLSCFIALLAIFSYATGNEVQQAEPQNKDSYCYDSISITILYSNNPFDKRLKTSWGFSCLIKGVGKNILFDTGADGELLLSNMHKLGINPDDVDIVFISHTHLDHIGGLWKFLDENHDVDVYLPASSDAHFSMKIKSHKADVIKVSRPMKVTDFVFTTGELKNGISEQSLVINTPKGIIIVVGCAHPGVVRIVRRVANSFGRNIILLVGGFHLLSKSKKEIYDIANNIKSLGVRYVAPEHCSGDKARAIFKKVFKDRYIESGAGKVIYINNLK